METIDVIDSDEREEGEIVDDDFEDISDSSLTLPTQNGKLTSSKRHLRGLSLSSISDGEMRVSKRRRKSETSTRRRKKRKHTHKKSENSDESDHFDDSILKKQIKATVTIKKEDWHTSSLKTRLQIMKDLKTVPVAEKSDEPEKIDSELMVLRSEALLTAIQNKYNHKRKKKPVDEGNISDNSAGNKENTDKNSDEPVPTQEEDEDILRANLLASMSSKIAKPAEKPETAVKKTDNPPAKPINSYKVIRKTTNNKPLVKMPIVKPLIINITNESDTDDDVPPNIEKDIQLSVDKFLKEQRAQVEAKSTNVSTPVLKTKPNPTTLIKSAVKLLPEDKQREYQELILKLAKANKKTKPPPAIKKVVTVNKPISNGTSSNNAKIVGSNNNKIVNKVVTNDITILKSCMDFKKEFYVFKNVYKEMQEEKNGRLQIRDSYTNLKPTIAKIFAADKERKKHEKRVRELMLELNTAKKKLDQSQQVFCHNVQDLIVGKRKIDSSEIRKPPVLVPETPNIPDIPLPPESPEKIEEQINFGDPNDIHKILEIQNAPVAVTTLSEYISPLDSKRVEQFDPLAIICPYEVNGNCRDNDCKFNHIL